MVDGQMTGDAPYERARYVLDREWQMAAARDYYARHDDCETADFERMLDQIIAGEQPPELPERPVPPLTFTRSGLDQLTTHQIMVLDGVRRVRIEAEERLKTEAILRREFLVNLIGVALGVAAGVVIVLLIVLS